MKAENLRAFFVTGTDTGVGKSRVAATLLAQYRTPPLSYEQINPVALRLAIAPHLAAASERRTSRLDRLVGLARGLLMQCADVTLVEGAGGLRVPLNSREFLSGLTAALNMPVILVVGVRLSCINQALLTAEAIHRDGLQLAGWVANHLYADMPAAHDNIATLRDALPAPCLGELPRAPEKTPEDSAQRLDLVRFWSTGV